MGHALQIQLISNPKEGIPVLKFIYSQFYDGKLAWRYGHAPTNECPLCIIIESCTHIAGECQDHKAFRISRNNSVCQLVHAAIRKTSKGGGALHSAPDVVLVATDTGSQFQTSVATLAFLSFVPEGENIDPRAAATPIDWLAPLYTMKDIRRRRHTDISQDPRYIYRGHR
jgi:hypothetical protein